MRYTLGQAAKATGRGKTTIQRAIQSGKLSADRNDDGSYAIDPAELSRVFDLVHLEQSEERSTERDATPIEDVVRLAVLEESLRASDAAYKALEERLRDVETVRDYLMEQNERLTLMLSAPKAETVEHPTQPQAEQPTNEPPSPRPWWRRLLG